MAHERLPFTRPDVDEATIQRVADVLRSGWLASGPKVKDFERELSLYVGGRPVRALTSATEAIEIALLAAGVGRGHEVITSAMSFCATANMILKVGATPVFVDADLDTRNISLEQTAAAITQRTRAILPVHFAGLPVDLDELYSIARHHDLRVIEDAAHAIGSSFKGERIGSRGDLVCFSFHPNKNMTTGEGGALVATSEGDLQYIERARFHGIERGFPGELDVLFPGMKANMSDIAACIGLGQLARLDEFNARRRRLVQRYFELWAKDCPLLLPVRGDEGHSWHMFAPLLPLDEIGMTRTQFIMGMDELGIAVGVHYQAIHTFSAYRNLGWRAGMFPNAERIGRETVTLPLFPAMRDSDVDRVVDAVNQVLGVRT
ncbi:MAG TPA: DegT/DnrJ/EryC1/StrS aminotransferase family protein [Steroidobacteraceae bacterium]|nr:DegT/DnrJ/EryC1/StrS aminotransferase family protein [Steroidobacteraceae bacterium]